MIDPNYVISIQEKSLFSSGIIKANDSFIDCEFHGDLHTIPYNMVELFYCHWRSYFPYQMPIISHPVI